MESLLAKALESKLKYWLKTFTRDQFKLQGRTVLLQNLDLNGDVLHASLGLPPSLRVDQARVQKFQLKLPSFSNVTTEPTVVEIDKLDLVLLEKSGNERENSISGSQMSASAKSTSYTFADKIADGMTIHVGTVNLTLETRGGTAGLGGAAWTPPLASVTICNLVLYTTSEHWKVVSLSDARDYSRDKKCIYVFKRLEWDSLSVDLLPHPDMFMDDRITSPSLGDSTRDNDGARRLFFGGERFLDKISGTANITMQRTEQNNPLALEVQFQLPEALCPSLSEPGLRALLRFMTGIYVCLNREDVDPKGQQSADAAGRSMVAVHVDHIFLCIKEAEFQLELLVQALHYVRASVGDGDSTRTMARLELGAIFLRDAFSRPTCTLIQPSMRQTSKDFAPVPSFASEKLWPRTYPLDNQLIPRGASPPMLCMYSSQTTPSPLPPNLASQMVFQCQPLKINLQEQSCVRIASFIADGIAVEPGVVLPDTSLNAFYFNLKEFDATIPIKASYDEQATENGFTGARLHVEGFVIAQSPFLNYRLLQLDKDPACFALWKGQSIDASQKRLVMRATQLSIALETASCDDLAQSVNFDDWASGLWICVEMRDPSIEIAMVSHDGSALVTIPPPGGIVRVGVSCKRYVSNTSTEQLLFILRMYAYMIKASETLFGGSKAASTSHATGAQELAAPKKLRRVDSVSMLVKRSPSDTAVILALDVVELKLLESLPGQITVEGPLLVRIISGGIYLKVAHRAFGGATEVSSSLCWQDINVECVETEPNGPDLDPLQTPQKQSSGFAQSLLRGHSPPTRVIPDMRAVFWIGEKRGSMQPSKGPRDNDALPPFLDVNVSNFIPYKSNGDSHALKVSAKVAGIRLGGGMVYNEALLHRFGVLGPDGGPGEEVKKLLHALSSGPLADLFKPTTAPVPTMEGDDSKMDDENLWDVSMPDNVNLDIKLEDWLFVLEGVDGVAERVTTPTKVDMARPWEEKCWHSTFRCFRIIACSQEKLDSPDDMIQDAKSTLPFPVNRVTMHIEGLQALKPRAVDGHRGVTSCGDCVPMEGGAGNGSQFSGLVRDTLGQENSNTRVKSSVTSKSGLDFEVRLVAREEASDSELGLGEWVVDSLRVAVAEPVEVEATKSEVEFLIDLCKAEIESASRITAGGLKLLNLPIGQSAIEQLSSVGSGSLENLLSPDRAKKSSRFSTPDRIRRDGEMLTPTYRRSSLGAGHSGSKLAGLEVALSTSQDLLSRIQNKLGYVTDDGRMACFGGQDPSSGAPREDLSHLNEQLLHMQALLSALTTESST